VVVSLLLGLVFAGPDLVGEWHFDEGTGTTTADSSGYGNTGNLNGNYTWNSSGKFLYGIKLYGNATDFVSIADSDNLDLGGNYTLEAWVNFDDFYKGSCEGNTIVGKGLDGLGGWYAIGAHTNSCSGVNPNHYFHTQVRTTTTVYTVNAFEVNISKGTWYHVVGSWNGTHLRIYVNGTLRNTSASETTGTLTPNAFNLFIGRMNNTNFPYPFNGTIDQVRVYNRTLSDAEVLAHANCNYERDSGNWHIDGKAVFCRAYLNLTGNMTVSSNSNLTLEYATLNFNSTGTTLATGAYGLTFNSSGGVLFVNSSTITRPVGVYNWIYVYNLNNFSSYNSTYNLGGGAGGFNQRGMWVGQSTFTFIGNLVMNASPSAYATILDNPTASTNAIIANNQYKGNAWGVYMYRNNNNTYIFNNNFSGTTASALGLDAAGSFNVNITPAYNNNFSANTRDVYINDESTSQYCSQALLINSEISSIVAIVNGSGGGCEARNSVVSINTNNTQNTHFWGNYTVNTLNSNQTFSPVQDGSLVGQYRFEEWPKPITTTDYSGNAEHGTITNNPDQVLGRLGWALYFNGTNNQHVQLPFYQTKSQMENYGITWAAWIKTSNVTGTVITQTANGAGTLERAGGLVVRNGKVEFTIYNGTTYVRPTSTTFVNDSQWHHIAGVFRPNRSMEAYVDGVMEDSRFVGVAEGDGNSVNIKIGYGDAGDPTVNKVFFNGTIDDVSIWNRSLSSDEIAALAGKPIWVNRNVTMNSNTYFSQLRITYPNFTWYNVSYINPSYTIIDANSVLAIYNSNMTVYGNITNNGNITINNTVIRFNNSWFNNTGKHVYISYSNLTAIPGGVLRLHAQEGVVNFTLVNSYISNIGSDARATGAGIGTKANNSFISNNTIYLGYSGIHVDNPATNVTITYNNISDISTYAVVIRSTGSAQQYVLHNTMRNSPSSGAGGHAASGSGAGDTLWTNNTIYNISIGYFFNAKGQTVNASNIYNTSTCLYLSNGAGNLIMDTKLNCSMDVDSRFLFGSASDTILLNSTYLTEFNDGNTNYTVRWRNVKVVDEDGNAVASADVNVTFDGVNVLNGSTNSDGILIGNLTDMYNLNGTIVTKSVNITAAKSGYIKNSIIENASRNEVQIVLAPSGGAASGYDTGTTIETSVSSATFTPTVRVGSSVKRGPWQDMQNVSIVDNSSGSVVANFTHNFSEGGLPLGYLTLELGSNFVGIGPNLLSVRGHLNKSYTLNVPTMDSVCNTQICEGTSKLRDTDCSSSDWSSTPSTKSGSVCLAAVSGSVVRDQSDLTSIVSVPDLSLVWVLIIFILAFSMFVRFKHE
jgi:hypothetical protein